LERGEHSHHCATNSRHSTTKIYFQLDRQAVTKIVENRWSVDFTSRTGRPGRFEGGLRHRRDADKTGACVKKQKRKVHSCIFSPKMVSVLKVSFLCEGPD